eukprot:TRINITY_DN9420_c0_g2_i2.p1 TRINITY_DN9420_c0_g2~~TRINITY_DN9420_c0_g2_i2.p1  ORF type:complete len:2538 (+),score=510.05 TRINITY_DN9420_c0_g2_i2:206-7819(+)
MLQAPSVRVVFLLTVAAGAVDIKSLQVWAPRAEQRNEAGKLLTDLLPGEISWAQDPQIQSLSLDAPSAETTVSSGPAIQSAERAPINPWTFVGCLAASGGQLSDPEDGYNPLSCVLRCDKKAKPVAAMKGTMCYCLTDRKRIASPTDPDLESRCDLRCSMDYYEGVRRLCGGVGQYVSLFQKYDMVHQTAQGCYDPWRSIWYQSVAIELPEYGQDGEILNMRHQFFLHAASINSGDPLFPYQRALRNLLMGLQYDLDNSRIVGHTVPYWSSKEKLAAWTPAVEVHRVNSLTEDNIQFFTTTITYNWDGSNAQNWLLGTGISALDALHNVYYVTMPTIPQDTDEGLVHSDFQTMLYGINLNTNLGDRVIVKRRLEHRVLVLEANSKFHDLFALLLQDKTTGPTEFFYVKLGGTYLNNRTLAVQFDWTFTTPIECVVNPFTYQYFTTKVYQVGISTVDHIGNTSYFVYKDTTNTDSPLMVEGISQRGFLQGQNLPPLATPDVQATWLVNTDPRIPLTLAAPKLVSGRFTIDGRSILVELDTFTVKGALPLDTDGDSIPDSINWATQHVGMRHCSDIFARSSAELLGPFPATKCEWKSGTTVQIHVSREDSGVEVGDALFIKDRTVYVYLAEENAWSMAASGGITVGLPFPMLPPEIDISYSSNVDLCSPVTLDGLKSYRHGDRPRWKWSLTRTECEHGAPPNQDLVDWVSETLQGASEGSRSAPLGRHTVSFGKDDLEPGCTYKISVTLSGRWGLASTRELLIFKRAIPAPQVLVMGPRVVNTVRSERLVLQSQVSKSECESLMAEQKSPRFLWSAVTEGANPFTGAIETTTVDLGDPRIASDVSGIQSATLVVPPFNLQPDETYSFRLKVGYPHSWNEEGATTTESVKVVIQRSPIKVNIIGGDRKVQSGKLCALDASASVDPDFPEQLIEAQKDWSFAYRCVTGDGDACFPQLESTELPDVSACRLGSDVFKDLGRYYTVPSFSSSEHHGDSYYCRHPTRNGILILNTGRLAAGRNYTFTVIAVANDRKAESDVVLEVLPEDLYIPGVVVDKIYTSKVRITQSLRITGDLIPEDRAQYGGQVAWSWSFFREDVNPRWSKVDSENAAKAGRSYMVPRKIFVKAVEVDAETWSPETFLSTQGSSNLVLKQNVLQPSSTYSFRLSAAIPHPYDPTKQLVGYADLKVATAGPPPAPGRLQIEPANESAVDVPKTLTAIDWSSEDVPMSFTFAYRTDTQSEFNKPVELRMSPLSEASQKVRCMRAGQAANNYYVEVSVTVYSLYGATSELKTDYRVLPPTDIVAGNNRLYELAEQVDPESRPTILNCIYIGPPLQGDGGPVQETAQETAERTKVMQDQADAMVDVLQSSSSVAAVTASWIRTNQQALQTLATEGGVVTDKMVAYGVQMAEAAAVYMEQSAESTEGLYDTASSVMNTLSSMLSAKQTQQVNTARQRRALNLNDPAYGAYFPASGRRALQKDHPVERVGLESSGYNHRRLQAYPQQHQQDMRIDGSLDVMWERWTADNALEGKLRKYVIRPQAHPQWQAVPERFHPEDVKEETEKSRRYLVHDTYGLPEAEQVRGPRSTFQVDETTQVFDEDEDMFSAQELLELEWLKFITAVEKLEDYGRVEAARDEEYFANYSAHLGAAEQEAVLRRWWEERARLEAAASAQVFTLSQLTRQMMAGFSRVSGLLVKYMVSGESAKEFNFPMGTIRIGKSRDLSDADLHFSLQDPNWKLPTDAEGAFGWMTVKFSKANPLQWADEAPTGPYLITALEVFDNEGAQLEVERQTRPLSVMSEHSSFASAGCLYWDWQANSGLGAWSRKGILNSDMGCTSTHLSMIGMFLDAEEVVVELPRAAETLLKEVIVLYENKHVMAGLSIALLALGLFHYWAFWKDSLDRIRPVEMRKLGDGVTKPRSQDDPVYYAERGCVRMIMTFWHLLCRDHVLAACFSRCPKLKVTRLQKSAILFAMLASCAAVCALFCGERVVDPRHYVEIGVISSILTFPLVSMLNMLFATRPARLDLTQSDNAAAAALFGAMPLSPQQASPGEFPGILEAMPVPDDELEDEEEEPEKVASPSISPGAAASGQAKASPQAVQTLVPKLLPSEPPPAGPEAGGGPTPLLQQAPIAARVLGIGRPPGPPPAGMANLPQPPVPPGFVPEGPSPRAELPGAPKLPPGAPPGAPPGGLPGGPPMAPPLNLPKAPSRQGTMAPSPAPSVLSSRPPSMAPPIPPESPAVSHISGISAPKFALPSPPGAPPGPPPSAAILPSGQAEPDGAGGPAKSPGLLPANPKGGRWEQGAPPVAGLAPPRPPIAGPRGGPDGEVSSALALREPEGGAVAPVEPEALPPMPDPAASYAAAEAAQAQAQLLRRVRRMYIEKVIRSSEKVAYDERVDMKSSVSHPMAVLANALAHIAVACYWVAALAIVAFYAVHFTDLTAKRWVFACLSAWAFNWFVLEFVKIALATILELSLFAQRRRTQDHKSAREKATMKKNMKWRQMEAIAAASGVFMPKAGQPGRSQSNMPPLPPEPPPNRGDASAG